MLEGIFGLFGGPPERQIPPSAPDTELRDDVRKKAADVLEEHETMMRCAGKRPL